MSLVKGWGAVDGGLYFWVVHVKLAVVLLAALLLPVFPSDDDAFRLAVETSLEKLTPEQRAVLHLKLWENLSFAKIAETLDISQNTAASRYRYALDKLRNVLRPVYEERL